MTSSVSKVKETKRQGRIAHHHADATVPHIVALLGFSFHAAKIGIIRLSSKLLPTFFYFDDKETLVAECSELNKKIAVIIKKLGE